MSIGYSFPFAASNPPPPTPNPPLGFLPEQSRLGTPRANHCCTPCPQLCSCPNLAQGSFQQFGAGPAAQSTHSPPPTPPPLLNRLCSCSSLEWVPWHTHRRSTCNPRRRPRTSSCGNSGRARCRRSTKWAPTPQSSRTTNFPWLASKRWSISFHFFLDKGCFHIFSLM